MTLMKRHARATCLIRSFASPPARGALDPRFLARGRTGKVGRPGLPIPLIPAQAGIQGTL